MAAKIIYLGILLPKMLIISQNITIKDTSGIPNPSLTLFKGILNLSTL